MNDIFIGNPSALLRTAIVGVSAYFCLLLVLRISRKRTLSKMNAFDFVVTVALGSTLATILLNKDVALAQGVLALALLVALQFVITWTSVRWPWIRALLTGEPRLLLYQGECLPKAMRRARVAEEEIRAAVRSAGLARLEEAEAIILETDGSLSVVKSKSDPGASALTGLQKPDSVSGELH